MKSKLILALLLVAALLPVRPAAAHQEHDHLFVATTGNDRGDCRVPTRPCRTIGYALQQATVKGAEIRVATGYYDLTDAETTAALSTLIWLQGGYRTTDYFAVAEPEKNPTYLLGVDARYRAALSAQGFIALQDKKGWVWEAATAELTAAGSMVSTAPATCVNSMAGSYPCQGIDLVGRIPLNSFPGAPTSASNIWGHTDLNTGREYALIGLRNGTGIVDITVPTQPTVVAHIPAAASLWRELRAYQTYDAVARRWRAYAYIVTEAAGQGVQIVDLSNLPLSATLLGTYTGVSRVHTIHLDNTTYDTNVSRNGTPARAILQGANVNSGAFRLLDLSNPTNPTLLKDAPSGTQYVHDGTSLVITDTRTADCYQQQNPCTIYVDYNENTVDLWDITNPATPYRISSTPYNGSQYTHSGWWTEDKRYLFIQDELDEYYLGHNTRVRTLDIANLRAPVISGVWNGPTRAIDHNGYTKGPRYYMSNYQRGLTILNITNPNALVEEAFFDSYPTSNNAAFNGAWGTYPYFPSGNVAISDIEGGFFLVREQRLGAPTTPLAALQLKVDSRPDSKINFVYGGALGVFRLDDAVPDDGDAFTAERFFTRAAGAYQITQQPVNGWYLKETRCQTSGAAEQVQPPGPLTLVLTNGAFVACTFINERTATVRILVYDDRNASGRRNSGELWLAGQAITLRDLSAGTAATQITNDLGKASFANLKPGSYIVCETVTAPWRNTQPGLDPELGQPCYRLTLAAGEIKTVYFGNTTNPVAFSGSVTADDNGVLTTMAPDDDGTEPSTEEQWLITAEPELVTNLYLPLVQQ
ncbi:MAG: choice-of-anchor B family protein [Caldilinea sp. CFX5]|nr:choice-of-anchor B family protein [Caldilinea sp. CFX5]